MASNTPSTSSPVEKKAKRKILTVHQKILVIEDYEKGMSRGALMEKYSLKKTTLHDILKAKEKTKAIMLQLEGTSDSAKVCRKRKIEKESLDDAVYQWYVQERTEGVPVRGVDIQHATTCTPEILYTPEPPASLFDSEEEVE